jgi:hypothetical protein
MTSHELAIQLLSLPDLKVTLSIDLDADDNHEGKRAFSGDVWCINGSEKEVVIISDGFTNFEYLKK